MKRILSISILLTLFACDNSMQIVSTKKQNIIPGVRSVKPYSNYLIEVQVNSGKTLKVDSVLVFELGNSCKIATHFIKDKSTNNVVKEVNAVGQYVIDATVNEKSRQVARGCGKEVGKVVVFYRVNNHKKEAEISSFVEETIRRR